MYKVMSILERHPDAEEELKKKWPKKLINKRDGAASEKVFMTWLIPKDTKQLSLFLILLIIAGLLIMLFPLWPMSIKTIIWYISFYLLVFLIGLTIVRAIVWTLFFILGLDFWIFPNLMEDTYYILDTFKPLYSFEIRKDDMRMFLLRMITLGCCVFCAYTMIDDPEQFEILKSGTVGLHDDLFDWGNEKFVTGSTANNQTLVDPNKAFNAKDVFAESV